MQLLFGHQALGGGGQLRIGGAVFIGAAGAARDSGLQLSLCGPGCRQFGVVGRQCGLGIKFRLGEATGCCAGFTQPRFGALHTGAGLCQLNRQGAGFVAQRREGGNCILIAAEVVQGIGSGAGVFGQFAFEHIAQGTQGALQGLHIGLSAYGRLDVVLDFGVCHDGLSKFGVRRAMPQTTRSQHGLAKG